MPRPQEREASSPEDDIQQAAPLSTEQCGAKRQTPPSLSVDKSQGAPYACDCRCSVRRYSSVKDATTISRIVTSRQSAGAPITSPRRKRDESFDPLTK